MKRIFYISDHQLSIYHWHLKQCITAYTFNADTNGFADFKTYLSSTDNTPTRILLDLMDEDLKIESIPHVGSTDRKSIISRLIDKHYRSRQHYVHCNIIGREGHGRKDDILRVTALRNPTILEPWLALIENHGTAISGVFSLPLLSPQIIRFLKAPSSNTLLIYLSRSHHLRQTFIHNKQVVMSRTTRLHIKGKSIAQQISHEVEQTHLFLSHNKHISKNKTIKVHVFYETENLIEFQKSGLSLKHLKYYFHNISDIINAHEITLPTEKNNTLSSCNLIFSHICHSMSFQASHYGKQALFIPFYTQLSSKVIYSICALVLITSTLYSLNNIKQVSILKSEIHLLQSQTNNIYLNYEKSFSPLANKLKQAQTMQSSVLLVDYISGLKAISPLNFMSSISQALNPLNLKSIQIDTLFWKQNYYTHLTSTNTKTSNYPFQGIATHYAKISGHILNLSSSIKDMIKQLSAFEEKLNQDPFIEQVRMIHNPFGIHSTIESDSNIKHTDNRFEFEILMKGNQS